MLTMWPVNKCDYMGFVHSYSFRMIGQLHPCWADDVTLALKRWCFVASPPPVYECVCELEESVDANRRRVKSIYRYPGAGKLPRVSVHSTREPLLSQNKLLAGLQRMSFKYHRMY